MKPIDRDVRLLPDGILRRRRDEALTKAVKAAYREQVELIGAAMACESELLRRCVAEVRRLRAEKAGTA